MNIVGLLLKIERALPYYIGAVIAGICLGVGFIYPTLSVLSLIGILWSIRTLVISERIRSVAVWCGIAWTVKYLCSISWFWAAYPISWIAFSSPVGQMVIIFLHWLTGAMWLGMGGVVFGVGLKYAARLAVLPQYLWYGLIPVWWVVGELAGALTFSLVGLGPGAYVQTYFSFGFLGYLLGYSPLGILIAPYGGVYTLTAILVTVGVVLFLLVKKQQYVSFAAVLMACGICVSVPFSSQPTPRSTMSVISINTTFDAQYLGTEAGQRGRAQSLELALSEALSVEPQFIIFPEDSRYLRSQFNSINKETIGNKFLFTHPNSKSIIIDSSREDVSDGYSVLRAHLLDAKNNQFLQFDKQYLVPQGEYIPALYGVAMHAFGYGPFVEKIERNNSYRPGPFLQSETIPAHLPAILFCFESVRPDGVRAITAGREVPFVAHPISHAWFHSSQILWQQLEVMLQIQARQSGIPIVSAGNMAPGKLYLPDGTVEEGNLLTAGERYELRLFTF